MVTDIKVGGHQEEGGNEAERPGETTTTKKCHRETQLSVKLIKVK